MPDVPRAVCKKHNAEVELKKFHTFCYWWCPLCKDEPEDVRLDVVHWSRAEKHYGTWAIKDPTDIVIHDAGIWKLTYTDGSSEFYEKQPNSSELALYRDKVQSAVRLADSDLPSRKPVQSLSISREGEIQKRQGIRALSNEADSTSGDKAFYDALDHIVPPADNIGAGSQLSNYSKSPLQVVEEYHFGIQHGKMPPDDEL